MKKGKVDVYIDGKRLRTVTKFDYFGERSVLFNEFRTATIRANGEIVCWMLDKSTFNDLLE